jgi:Zn-dependent peptidase ImmA (M78 family)
MNASTASPTVGRGGTKVCPGKGPAVEVVDVGHDVREEAEREAERLLRITANVGVPVEPAGIADRLGVRVREGELKDEIFGGLLIEPGEDPKILLNQRHGLIRRRLTCAHEIGHYIRQSAEVKRYVHIDRQGSPSISPEDPEGIFADEFGACLLMPAVVVQALMEIGMDELEMALWFVVSREAMQLRLTSLDLRVADRCAV